MSSKISAESTFFNTDFEQVKFVNILQAIQNFENILIIKINKEKILKLVLRPLHADTGLRPLVLVVMRTQLKFGM